MILDERWLKYDKNYETWSLHSTMNCLDTIQRDLPKRTENIAGSRFRFKENTV